MFYLSRSLGKDLMYYFLVYICSMFVRQQKEVCSLHSKVYVYPERSGVDLQCCGDTADK